MRKKICAETDMLRVIYSDFNIYFWFLRLFYIKKTYAFCVSYVYYKIMSIIKLYIHAKFSKDTYFNKYN